MSTRRKLRPSCAKTPTLKTSKTHSKSASSTSPAVSNQTTEDSYAFSAEEPSSILARSNDRVQDVPPGNGSQVSLAQQQSSGQSDTSAPVEAQSLTLPPPVSGETPTLGEPPTSGAFSLQQTSPLSRVFVQQLQALYHQADRMIPHMVQEREVLYGDFAFSLFECCIICALRKYVRNADGSAVNDDTAAEVVKAMRNSKDTVSCQGLYQHVMENLDKDDWEALVYYDVERRGPMWSVIANRYWKAWIACMNNICRRYKGMDRLEDITNMVQSDQDIEPFKSMYETGQCLEFPPIRRQRRMPVQRAMRMPMQGPTHIQLPAPTSMQMQMPWSNRPPVPLPMQMPVQRTCQISSDQQLEMQMSMRMQRQMQTQMNVQRQRAMRQIHREMQATMPLEDEAQRMPQITIPTVMATEMLLPYPMQPPTLPSQSKPLRK